jgi:dipeptidyl aminopeptidase/acylaminoacyl peptidase
MMRPSLLAGLVIAAGVAIAPPVFATPTGLTVTDMLAMQRVGDPAPSPDGRWLAFAVRDTDLEANRGRYDLWLATSDGASVTRLTTSPENDTDPAWSRDGKWIYFLSSRGGDSQVWRIAPTGGEAEQVTRVPVDVAGFKLFPDGRHLLLAADVWPEAKTLADSAKRDAEKAKSKMHARAYDHLLFRHWDQWEDGRFSHLFLWTSPEIGGHADDARDLMPGATTDVPTHPFGGMEEIDVAPDGKAIAYTQRVGGATVAWTTNTDVFEQAIENNAPRGKPVNLTEANKAYDFGAAYSPDGKTLAVRSMMRPGFESDRLRITLIDRATKKAHTIAEPWDHSPESLTWSPDGKTLYTTAENVGNDSLYAIDVASGNAKVLVEKGTSHGPALAGDRIVFGHDTLVAPAEIWSVKLDGTDDKQVTHLNDLRVHGIAWGGYEQFSFKGAHGDTVYGFAGKPANWDGHTKAPVAFLIHGGPQGSFGDHFHYRWNPEVFAGHGYATIAIDFHGSTGYGQKFTDSISNDWGGAPYEDLMTGLDAAVAKFPWLDGTRVVALGASYGGWMINWINGHTDRFKALVVHDGNLDERMAYYETEELWFPEWEHGGVPWEKPEGYAKANPIEFVKNWKTPTLVIHGGMDFRIPEAQGIATFTALQRKGVPSRFLEFPDENHWVLKPQNSKVWHEEVLAWLDKWAGKR